jgi:hypothetical protein
MRATCVSSWIRPYRFIMHQGYSGMAIFDPQLQIDSFQVFRNSPDADIEDRGNLIARLALDEPLKDFSFSQGQAKRDQPISRQLQQALLEQYGGKCTVVHIPNGEASGRSIDGQRSKFCRRLSFTPSCFPADGHPLTDLTGKSISRSGIRWPIALQEFARTGGCPFDTPTEGDLRAGLSTEFQESTMPVPILTLLQKFTGSLPVFLREGWFHMVSIIGASSRLTLR